MDEVPELLRSHYEDPYHRGSCERATHASQSQDAESSHLVLIQLRVSDHGVIEEAWFDSQGCIYCEAPASILVQYGESKSIEEIIVLDEASYIALTKLDQLPSPQSCQMLAWTALQHALNPTETEYEEGRPIFGGPSLGEES